MVPVTFASFGKSPAVCLIPGGIEHLSGRSIAGDAVALEISDMGSQRSRRSHLPNYACLDHGAPVARLQHARRDKARRTSAPEPAASATRAARETAGLLRGLERLRQKRLCSRPACRANSARANAEIVVVTHADRRNVPEAE